MRLPTGKLGLYLIMIKFKTEYVFFVVILLKFKKKFTYVINIRIVVMFILMFIPICLLVNVQLRSSVFKSRFASMFVKVSQVYPSIML